ncbi:MazG-like family protein [Streptomyces sp. NPDC003393]
MGDRTWDQVERLRGWLDEHTAPEIAQNITLWRVLKIGEEFGEAVEALHGATGANPRKGESHSWSNVEKELVDVIVTAMVALHTVSADPEKAFAERLDHLVDRLMPQQ